MDSISDIRSNLVVRVWDLEKQEPLVPYVNTVDSGYIFHVRPIKNCNNKRNEDISGMKIDDEFHEP